MPRTATFGIAGIEGLTDREIEKAWNEWVEKVVPVGTRPSENPLHWTKSSATFRLFDVQIEREVDIYGILDFDIRKLSALAACMGVLTMSVGLGYWRHILDAAGVITQPVFGA